MSLFDLICYLFPLVSVYSNDSVMIPRNSTVVVMRVPKPQKPSTQLVYMYSLSVTFSSSSCFQNKESSGTSLFIYINNYYLLRTTFYSQRKN